MKSDHLNLIPGTLKVEGKSQLLVSCPLTSTQINNTGKNIKHEEVEVSNVQQCTQDETYRSKMWPQHLTQRGT